MIRYSSNGGNPVFLVAPADLGGLRIDKVFGATWNSRAGLWLLPAMYPYGLVVKEDVDNLAPEMAWEEGAKSAITNLQSVNDAVSNHSLDGFSPKVKPYDHQIEALSLAIHSPRVALFLDPGLGKTKIGCDLIQYCRAKDPNFMSFIIALKVNQFTWKREMEFHSGGDLRLEPLVATSPKQREKRLAKILENPDGKLAGVVVTYDTCRVASELLSTIPFTCVIADESHSMRNPRSKKTDAVLKLVEGHAPRVTRRLILTGTPSLGSPLHLWAQLKLLGNFLVPNFWKFRGRHVITSPYNSNIVTGFKNVGILNDLVSLCSMRRTAEECLDLPERTIQVVPVNAGASLKRLYNTVASHDPITLSGKVVPSPENTITAMGRLAQMSSGFVYLSRKDPNICEDCPHLVSCVRENISPYTTACQVEQQDPGRDVLPVPGSPVMDTVKGLVEEHVNNGKKVILWGKHQYFMEQVSADLTKLLDCEVLRYDSTTESHSEVEAKFNSIEGPAVIVAQISMGIGVTFKAPVMIYGEVSWSLDHWLQSLDRNYGIRAKGFGKLLVQAVVVNGSIAHSTMELLNSKVDVSSMMSTRPNCVTCVNALKCLDEGTMPFDRACILQDTVEKTKIPVRRL